MRFAKTGFWADAEGTRALWARAAGSERRSELWELRVIIDEQHPENSVYEWVDARDEILHFGCGFTGYLGALRFQGWTCVPQPSKSSDIPHVLPHIPYPSAMLSGKTTANEFCDHGWTFIDPDAGKDVKERTGARRRWTCPVMGVSADDERDVRDMKLEGCEVWEFFGTPGDYVRAMLEDVDGFDAGAESPCRLSPFSWETPNAPVGPDPAPVDYGH